MSEHESRSAKDLFNVARMLPSDERTAYLDEACGGDAELRREVDQLLADYEAAGSFLESPTLPLESTPGDSAVGETTSADPSEETPGTLIGRYKILQQIGEGGFGRVYMAEQTKPIVRRVALKVIKLGMDTRQVIARFEAERQALAMMDHPTIAKVLDAGATSTGRPYFVMELVRGEPIMEYCDRNNLSIPERLDLFMQVCRAVQHAHQKGIIHRDLKPTNVMITIADGKPMPKVIDFGIAKATNARLTEKTLFTEFRQLIGTPQYMSPEQAEASGVDIDTRSDIYSLGVLLYELLTGTTPFEAKRLRSAAFGEIQRIIREEEPPKPSTRLSTLESLPNVAVHRGIEPKRLSAIIRGDLDWIVMKMLEKDRTRRYETADAVAQDVERHLNHEPVLAGPPSRGYKVRKFIVRHKVGVAASVAIALALVLGVIGTSGGMAWALSERAEALAARQAEADQRRIAEESERRAIEEAERAEREAERALAAEHAERERADELEKVSDFQQSMLSDIDIELMGVRLREDMLAEARAAWTRSRVDVDEIEQRAEQLERLVAGTGFQYAAMRSIDRNVLARALETIAQDFDEVPLVQAALLQTVANTYRDLGIYDSALAAQERALYIRRAVLGDDHPNTLLSVRYNDHLRLIAGRFSDDSETDSGGPIRMYRLGNEILVLPVSIELEDYAANVRERLLSHREFFGNTDRLTLQAIATSASAQWALGQFGEAELLLREAMDTSERLVGSEHLNTLDAMNRLAQLLKQLNRLDEAEPLFRRELDIRRGRYGDNAWATILAIDNMGILLFAQGRTEEAEQYLREAISRYRRVSSPNYGALSAMFRLANLLRSERRWDEANLLYDDTISGLRVWRRGDTHNDIMVAIRTYADALVEQGLVGRARAVLSTHVDAIATADDAQTPEIASWMSRFGVMQCELADFTSAVLSFEREISLWQSLGEEYAQPILEASRNLAYALNHLARHEEAEAILDEVVAQISNMNPPPPQMHVAEAHRELGWALLGLGRAEEAEGHLLTSIELMGEVDGIERWRIARIESTLGACLAMLDRYDDAETLVLSGHAELHLGRGDEFPDTLVALRRIINLYDAWHTTEPGGDHDMKAAEWRLRLERRGEVPNGSQDRGD